MSAYKVQSFTDRQGRTRFAFVERNGRDDSGHQTYKVRIRDADLSTKPVAAFEVSGHSAMVSALRRRGCEL